MKTVKEIADLTGISVRTLHYYDQINLLKPSKIKEPSGYRLYDDQALETLQQILFLKELGFPLKSIKVMINTNAKEKNDLLYNQKKLLILKRNRLNELINLIDTLKEGDSCMSFKEFDSTQIDELFEEMLNKFDKNQRNKFIEENGGNINNAKKLFEQHLKENEEDLDKYIGNENMVEYVQNIPMEELVIDARNKLNILNKELAFKMNCNIDDESVKNIIFKIRDAHKLIFPSQNFDTLFIDLGKAYLENEALSKSFDDQYGQGYGKFYGNVVLYYFK